MFLQRAKVLGGKARSSVTDSGVACRSALEKNRDERSKGTPQVSFFNLINLYVHLTAIDWRFQSTSLKSPRWQGWCLWWSLEKPQALVSGMEWSSVMKLTFIAIW